MTSGKNLLSIIHAMQELGAEYVRCDPFDICFNLPKDSDLAKDKNLLISARDKIKTVFGLTLKVRYLK